MQHLISLYDITPTSLEEILTLALDLKQKTKAGDRPALLDNSVLLQLFEKPSLRTRNSFEAAMIQLGGGTIFMTAKDAGFQGRESLADIAKVSSSYADFVTLRTFSHQLIQDYAENSACPVINALSDERHPCQALTDLMTVQEVLGKLSGTRLVFVGDGNNVACSLAIASAMTDVSFVVASPPGYELSAAFLSELRGKYPKADVSQTNDAKAAVAEADVVYTDVWASMGQESEAKDRAVAFADFQVNGDLMANAPKSCRFMHDLPARRGLEVTDDVIDSENSIVFTQAENRMHLAKALLVWLSKK